MATDAAGTPEGRDAEACDICIGAFSRFDCDGAAPVVAARAAANPGNLRQWQHAISISRGTDSCARPGLSRMCAARLSLLTLLDVQHPLLMP